MKTLLIGALMALNLAPAWAGDQGLVTLKSQHSFKDTQAKFEAAIQAKGLTLFAKVDHQDNATKSGLTMPPSTVLIFGAAKGGTPLMLASPTTGIDLPMKALVWEDASKQVFVSYNTITYLKQRHDIKGQDELIGKLNGLLGGSAKAATE